MVNPGNEWISRTGCGELRQGPEDARTADVVHDTDSDRSRRKDDPRIREPVGLLLNGIRNHFGDDLERFVDEARVNAGDGDIDP
jgi:hypothetical protein